MSDRLNFSPQPFRTRNSGLVGLWALNIALLICLGLCYGYWNGLRDQNQAAHDDIGVLHSKQQELSEQNKAAIKVLESIETKSYRTQVRQFYDIQTAFQTHWGKLLDALGKIMPEDVRLRELRPITSRDEGKGRITKIHLLAETRNKEAQLNFIRALQTHASFEDLSFESETYGGEGLALSFEISFNYNGGP